MEDWKVNINTFIVDQKNIDLVTGVALVKNISRAEKML